jgi:hypothetical protein
MDRSVDALVYYEDHATWWGYSGHIWLDLRGVKSEHRMTVTHGVADNLRLVHPHVEFGWAVADWGCGHTIMSVRSYGYRKWVISILLFLWMFSLYIVSYM